MQRSDFTLVFNRAEVPCHKTVLAAASPVFEAMVESNHLEALESKANIADGPTRAYYAWIRMLQAERVDAQLPEWLRHLWVPIRKVIYTHF